MISIDDDLSGPFFKADDLDRIAYALNVSVLSAEHIEKLEQAALRYRLNFFVEEKTGPVDNWRGELPTRNEQRKALHRVSEAALELKDALEDRVIHFLDSDLLPKFDTDSLEKLAKAADHTAKKIKGGGEDPKLDRITFVCQLAEIYEDITQKPATRQHDPMSGLDSGPFLDFAKAALKPLNAPTLKGLEHVVRQVVKIRSVK